MVKVRERKYFLGSIQSEKLIRLNGLKKVDPHSNQLYSMACKFLNKYQKIKIDKAYSFAKKIKYKHGNMSPEIYFAHPKRVSALSMLLYDNNFFKLDLKLEDISNHSERELVNTQLKLFKIAISAGLYKYQ